MPTTRVFVRPWRNDAAASSFPFVSTLEASADTGFPFPVAAVLDASFYAVPGRLLLTQIDVAEDGVATIWVGTEDEPKLASAEVAPADTNEQIAFRTEHGRDYGILVVDPTPLQTITAWTSGSHGFAEQLEFVVSTIFPASTGIEGFLLDDGTLLTDDVWLVGEDGVVVRSINGLLRVDVVGDPIFRRALCEESGLFVTPRFVKTISGISPDDYNGFTITPGLDLAADTILRIVPDKDGQGLWVGLVGQTAAGETRE